MAHELPPRHCDPFKHGPPENLLLGIQIDSKQANSVGQYTIGNSGEILLALCAGGVTGQAKRDRAGKVRPLQ
jgi:hypothetical protein